MENTKLFEELKSILKEYEGQLSLAHDKSTNYYLNTSANEKNKKGEFFGAVQVKKSYIAYHLMPVYYNPELLDSVSEDLKKRMQGKSCFNFNQENKELLKELAEITKTSFEHYKKLGKV
ncbi:hypothetical protein [uncultured Croceitalea sp.]|uniref:hypothetical protein n=1 Tax=uncultured Croceitalea sp. TaxID=1798908 RepID=UPI0033060891